MTFVHCRQMMLDFMHLHRYLWRFERLTKEAGNDAMICMSYTVPQLTRHKARERPSPLKCLPRWLAGASAQAIVELQNGPAHRVWRDNFLFPHVYHPVQSHKYFHIWILTVVPRIFRRRFVKDIYFSLLSLKYLLVEKVVQWNLPFRPHEK